MSDPGRHLDEPAAHDGIDIHVWHEVRRIHTDWLADTRYGSAPEPDLDEYARRLTARINRLEAWLLEEMVTTWITAYAGQLPTVAQVAAWSRIAYADARHQVLCEDLYRAIPSEVLAAEHSRTADVAVRRYAGTTSRPHPDRWRIGGAAIQTSPAAEAVVARTWPTMRSPAFISTARTLVQVRVEDGLPIPATPLDPLAEELETMVHDHLAAENLPPI
ncbi:hypothetical protein ACIGO9_31240 [Nocardia asteroides]|uniref:hypothetical protein n=1 Tax=Nocardia asteroides TaxID=1824 RepID=UPI0037C58C7F